MSKVEIITRDNQEEFSKCCYFLVIEAKKKPLVLVKAIEQGVEHFEIRRKNKMVDIRAVLMDKAEKTQTIN